MYVWRDARQMRASNNNSQGGRVCERRRSLDGCGNEGKCACTPAPRLCVYVCFNRVLDARACCSANAEAAAVRIWGRCFFWVPVNYARRCEFNKLNRSGLKRWWIFDIESDVDCFVNIIVVLGCLFTDL